MNRLTSKITEVIALSRETGKGSFALPSPSHFPCSSRNFSTSMAAIQPVPAAVIACR